MLSKILLSSCLILGFAAHSQAADTNIDQLGQKFSVSTAALKVGDSLHFLNRDDVTHNINVIDADDNHDDKGLQKPGETIDQKFSAAGEFQVRCSIHPKMKMSVKVQ